MTDTCRWKSSQWQLSACSIVKHWPHTQWEGRWDGHQPYRRCQASLKAPLCKAKPYSEMGRTESQLEAPFSKLIVIAFLNLVGKFSFRLLAALASSCLLDLRAFFLLLSCSSFIVGGNTFDWFRISCTRGAEINSELEWCIALLLHGFIPSPTRRAGSANIHVFLCIIEGIFTSGIRLKKPLNCFFKRLDEIFNVMGSSS